MIQNQVGAGLAPLGNFCDIAGCAVTSTPLLELFCLSRGFRGVRTSGGITQNAQKCQTGTRWFQPLKGTSYPKPLKKFINIFVWG